ncbi:caveolin-2 [Entelurus aequoreus]|uniref:caveolin-2 n=1 Tax=Entelurus aequoreus TaxID=161455 RepID=UPI002B1DAA6B|nr:caveolin-2 [Entelurus aequoreus]
MGVEEDTRDTRILVDEDGLDKNFQQVLDHKKRGQEFAARADRDPNHINAHLKVDFDDVIAEPPSARSSDKVWIFSHALFHLVRFLFYRVISVLLAVPVAFILGLFFAMLGLVHVWLATPAIRSFLLLLPSARRLWTSCMDLFLTPFFQSAAKICSRVDVQTSD